MACGALVRLLWVAMVLVTRRDAGSCKDFVLCRQVLEIQSAVDMVFWRENETLWLAL